VRLNVSELEDLVGASDQQFWSYVKDRYGLPESVAYYARAYNEDREIASYDQTLLSPGLDTLFDELRTGDLRIALATSGSRKRMNAVIELYGLPPWLDVALCREDSARGIAAARAAEMFVLGFNAYCVTDAHMSEADAQIASFQGLGLHDFEALWAARTPA
jgi:beta-phosphoglucomutase-like phosphatase (HAD superfamily)